MAHEPETNGYSIIMPLLVDNNEKQEQQKVGLSEANKVEPKDFLYNLGSASFYKTCFNGLNALSGLGILSVPYALSSGGWLSLILLLVVACSALYTGLLIQRCMDIDSSIYSFSDIGDRAFGAKGRAIVSILMNTELYLVATTFLILEGDNLSKLLPCTGLKIGSFDIDGRQIFVVVVALIILPMVWLNSMSILSYISAGGVVASLVLVCSILWLGEFDGIGFHEKGRFLDWSAIPISVSLYAFCYCAHPVFPTLYTSMRNRKHFSKVLFLCFFLCTLAYGLMAILGYLMFGSNVQSQITLNLPTNKISSKVAIYTTLITPIAKYPLIITPIFIGIENRLLSGNRKRSLSLLIRTSLVFSTVIVALTIPFFGYLMSLVGAFLSISASIILPCLCYLKISGIYKRFSFELMTIAGITLMGIAIMITGTYTSFLEIMRHLLNGN